MSRIIVKNLPKQITDKKIQALFSSKGCITDVQLKYTKEGRFRQFAFVGFKTEEEAKAAKEYFHETFIHTSKIKIEICSNLCDPNKPKPWSKHSKEKIVTNDDTSELPVSETRKDKKKKKKADKHEKNSEEFPEELMKDPKFQEFLEVNKLRSEKPIWGDDCANVVSKDADGNEEKQDNESDSDNEISNDETGNVAKSKAVSNKEYFKSKIAASPENGKEEPNTASENNDKKIVETKNEPKKEKDFDDRFTVKLKNLPFRCKKKHIKKFFHPLKLHSLRISPKIKGFAYVKFGSEKEMKQALNKHKGFLEGRRIDVIKYERRTTNGQFLSQEEEAKKREEDMELLAESGRLFVRNLCHDVSQEELEKLFGKFGPLAEVHVPIDRFTKEGLGYAFVSYVFVEHAVKAFSELDRTVFQGRTLHLIAGRAKKETNDDIDELPFKKKKEAKIKALSGSSHNWNTLFLGMNTVADFMSAQYNIDKATLLTEEENESIPVRMALGETQLVVETRDFLTRNGVQLDSFSQPAAERSKTVIIVKNLPAKTSPSEINALFSKYGIVSKVVLPPTGVTALVVFQHPTEAKAAFQKLAYSRFQFAPLYLEWAPMNVFKESSEKTDDVSNDQAAVKVQEEETSNATKSKDEEMKEEVENELDPEQGTTLFVKNLNFMTTDESLKKHFKKYGPLYSVSVSKKMDVNSGKLLSMGFGFVQFRKKSMAVDALQDLQYSELDGHKIEIKFSNRATFATPETTRMKATEQEQKTSKILVRNIPFEVTEREIRNLFKEFGNLKTVRLPKKFSGEGSHRGFGFVDFVSKSNAKRAFNALCHSTHLLGRRLVLEWANPDSDDVSELRKKTARDFYQGGPVKKLKKSKLNEDVMLTTAKGSEDVD